MTKRIVVGPGACGFLRINKMLNSCGVSTRYKGGKVKFQNSFETWNPEYGLIWNSVSLTPSDRYKRAKHYYDELQNGVVDIGHSPINYISELISIDKDIKFICLLPKNKEHAIASLFTHWGYRNPVKTKRKEYRARYVLEQFPDYSDEKYIDATKKYWEEYEESAKHLAEKYPNNFIIVDTLPVFDPELDSGLIRKKFSDFFNIPNFVDAIKLPVDTEQNILTTTLHGGLGNNLFQMAECIAFASEHNLPKPVFGTWKLQNGGGMFPHTYNADAFLGRHTGTHEELAETFCNVNWVKEVDATYDTKFMINDMFDFSRVNHERKAILENFKLSKKTNEKIETKYGFLFQEETTSLHLRTCTLAADDHVNGEIPFEFHIKALNQLPDQSNVLVFSDNNAFAKGYIERLKQSCNKNFILIEENQFVSVAMMAKCKNHILHVSTMSFWGAYLDENQMGKTFYHENFNKCHTERMIPKELNWIKLA